MRIQIVTDAWTPQINGVVRTLQSIAGEISEIGHSVGFVTPEAFPTLPCPTYPEIRLSLTTVGGVGKRIRAFRPDAIHIATEGPLGHAARRFSLREGLPFTTAFHTKFPEYVHARFGVPVSWGYALLRRFHGEAVRTMVGTPTVRRELEGHGFRHLVDWGRGVDVDLFHPHKSDILDLPRPIAIYVGRVAVEKNLGDFLDLDLPGTKVIIGDGPARETLARRYPEAVFVGAKHGEELASHYAAADVFVFPSRTDTFGLVLLEALASGVPVAAYPVAGPRDVIDGAPVGCLDADLARAAQTALDIDPAACRAFAETRSWRSSAEQFLANLAPFNA